MLYETVLGSTFEISDSTQSVSDPFSGLISDPTRPRSILLRADPLEADGTTTVDFDVSTDGYRSLPGDSPEQQFPQKLINPYNFSVSLPIPELSGALQLGIGNISVANADGSLDTIARKDWLGIDQNLYLGPPEPASLGEFTKIQRGISAGLSWDLNYIDIINRDQRFKLQRPLHRSRYRGFGACLRGNGTTSLGNATITCPAGSMTFECQFRPSTLAATLKYLMAYQSSGAAGGRILRFDTGANNRIAFYVVNDAAVLYSIFADDLFPVSGTLKHIAAVLDVPNLKIRLYVEGEEAATPVTIAGTFNTVLNDFKTLRRPDTASSYMDGDIDEIRIWPIARTQAQIRDTKDRELLGTEGQTAYWKLNEGSGAGPSANSVAGGVGLTLSNTTWVGSLEGDSSLVGTVKPIALGVCRQVEPRWVDTQRLVVQYHDGSMQEVTAQRDKGDVLTFGADVSDIYSATPSAGTYNTCKAMGLARFGSTPVGTLTADIQGVNGGIIGYADSAAEIDKKLMVDYAGLDIVTEIDDFAYNNLQLLNSAVIGRYYDEEVNIDVASSEILSDIRAWGGPTRIGVRTVGRIDNPLTQVPTVTWTNGDLDMSSGEGYHRDPLGVRYREVVIGYRPYYKPLSADQVAGVVPLATRDDFSKEYRFVSKQIAGASEDASVLRVFTSMDSEADAKVEMERLADFLGRDLETVNVLVTNALFRYFIGTIVGLTITQELNTGVTVYRYASNNKPYVVVGISEVIAAGQPDRFSATLVGESNA